MNSFYVIVYDVNSKSFGPYDIIPYLKGCYCEAKDKPKTLEEFKDFIKSHSLYQWWSRCEYEIILSDWPSQCQQKKIDVHYQVMTNLDAVTKVLMESINDC